MNVTTAAIPSLTSQPVQNSGSTGGGVCRGRFYSVVRQASKGAAAIVNDSNALYKTVKMVGGLSTCVMLAANDPEHPVARKVSNYSEELAGFISPLSVVERLNFFVSGKFRTKSADGTYKYTMWKCISAASLVLSKSVETMIWLTKRGVVNLGKAASNVGGSVLYQAAEKITLKAVKSTFVVIASASAIVDEIIKLAAKNLKSAIRPSASIVENVGKIALTVGSKYWYSWPFAIGGVITGSAALTKILYDVYATE